MQLQRRSSLIIPNRIASWPHSHRTQERSSKTIVVLTILSLILSQVGGAFSPVGRWLVAGVDATTTTIASYITTNSSHTQPNLKTANNALSKLPLSFEPNVGQTDPSVRFLVHAPGSEVFFENSGIVLKLRNQASRVKSDAVLASGEVQEPSATSSVVRMRFIGSNQNPAVSASSILPGKINYLLGNDPTKWHTNVTTYSSVTYRNLYPGVNLRYDGTAGSLKGTYDVAAGANADSIRWLYDGLGGVSNATVDATGNLQVVVADRHQAPSGNSAVSRENDGRGSTTITEQAPDLAPGIWNSITFGERVQGQFY